MFILTTNRKATMDKAVESRITVDCEYANLNRAARLSILTNYLESDLDGNDGEMIQNQISRIAEKDVTGRDVGRRMELYQLYALYADFHQIVDILKFATLLTMGGKLTHQHIEKAYSHHKRRVTDSSGYDQMYW